MWVFQPGDELRLGFKAANEFGLVGVFFEDDFDRHFTSDGGLKRPVNRSKSPCPDFFTEFVPFNDAIGFFGQNTFPQDERL